MSKLQLNSRPDAYGFVYGHMECEGETVSVDIMPPVSEWAGDMHLDGYEPHATDWVLYADGQEVGRVAAAEKLEEAVLALLPEGRG